MNLKEFLFENWKNNKFGVLALLFLVLYFVLFLFLFLFSFIGLYFLTGPLALFSTYLGLVALIGVPVLALVSLLRREENRFFPALALLLFLFYAIIMSSSVHYPPTDYGKSDPVSGASNALKEAYQTPSQLAHSQQVTFTRDYVLPAKTIIESADIGISEEQICLSLGDFEEMMGEQFTGNDKKIVYQGGSPKTVKVSTLCYYGDELTDLIDDTYTDIDDLDSSWLSNCGCVNSTDLCCLIALKKPV